MRRSEKTEPVLYRDADGESGPLISEVGLTANARVSSGHSKILPTNTIPNLNCGIFLDYHFGTQVESGRKAIEQWRALGSGVDAGDLEESSDGWVCRVVVEMLEVDDLNRLLDRIETIALEQSGYLVSPHGAGVGEESGPMALREFALSSFALGKYFESTDRWRWLIERGQVSKDEGLLWIGSSELAGERNELAKEAFLECWEGANDPVRKADAQCGLGWCEIRKGNIEQGELYFLEALSIELQSQSHYGLAYCRASQGLFDSAVGWLKLAVRTNPEWKRIALREPAFRAVRDRTDFQEMTKISILDRGKMLWNRLPFPWKRRGDFVDRFRTAELY